MGPGNVVEDGQPHHLLALSLFFLDLPEHRRCIVNERKTHTVPRRYTSVDVHSVRAIVYQPLAAQLPTQPPPICLASASVSRKIVAFSASSKACRAMSSWFSSPEVYSSQPACHETPFVGSTVHFTFSS